MLAISIVPLVLAAAPPIDTEARALAYLAREVPRWHREKHCFACHHHADAGRALLTARAMGRRLPDVVFAPWTDWLQRPAGWDKNGGEEFSDKKLARLQFASTLATLRSSSREIRQLAAKLLVEVQDGDGSWRVVSEGTLGGATTLGTSLATHLAREALAALDTPSHRDAIQRADRWLATTPIHNLLDASAVLLSEANRLQVKRRERALTLIRTSEAREGGWGPHPSSAPEAFDTAIVLLALSRQKPSPDIDAWIRRGRAYLRSLQEADGSWPETTRPSGGDSYSQRLSTTGWVTLALLATSARTAP